MRLIQKLLTLTAASILFTAPAHADHYTFDKQHTHIAFYVNHLGFSDMLGLFTDYDGGFTFDEKSPETSSVDVTLKPAGIHTTSAKLDEHIQGPQFFNATQYPTIHFVSSSVKVTGDHTGDVLGNLTLLGVTKPVTLHVQFNKADTHPMTGMYTAGFNANTVIKRSDFGMTAYVPMVGDDVRLDISTEGTDQDRAKVEPVKH